MKHIAITFVTSFMSSVLAACVDAPGDDRGEPTTEAEVAALEEVAFALARDASEECPVVAEEGPCSVACDKAALAEYIQVGTCMQFGCEAADGSLILVGGCR